MMKIAGEEFFREKTTLETCASLLVQSSFCFAVRVVCEIYYETNGIVAQKNSLVGDFVIKKFRVSANRIVILPCCQVSRK
jgi:hypothetical protein